MNALQVAILIIIGFLGPLLTIVLYLTRDYYPGSTKVMGWALGLSNIAGLIGVLAVVVGKPPVVMLSDIMANPQPFFYSMNFSVDRFTAFFLVAIFTASLLTTVIFYRLRSRQTEPALSNSIIQIALLTFAAVGVTLAQNAIGLVFFLEIITFTLFLITRSRPIFLAQSLGVISYLVGLFFLSQGALFGSFETLAYAASEASPVSLTAAFILTLLGTLFTAGHFPFTMWTNKLRQVLDTPVATLAVLLARLLAVYTIIRVLLFIFPAIPLAYALPILIMGLLGLLVSMVKAFGNLASTGQISWLTTGNISMLLVFLGLALVAGSQSAWDTLNASLFAIILSIVPITLVTIGLQNFEATRQSPKPIVQIALVILVFTVVGLPPLALAVPLFMLVTSVMSMFVAMIVALQAVMTVTLVAVLASYILAIITAVRLSTSPKTETQNAWPQTTVTSIAAWTTVLLSIFAPVILSTVGGTTLTADLSTFQAAIVVGGHYYVSALVVVVALILIFLAHTLRGELATAGKWLGTRMVSVNRLPLSLTRLITPVKTVWNKSVGFITERTITSKVVMRQQAEKITTTKFVKTAVEQPVVSSLVIISLAVIITLSLAL